MRRTALILVFGVLSLWAAGRAINKLPNTVENYPGEVEDPDTPLPNDWTEKTEWCFARLRYPSVARGWWARGNGPFYTSWGIDSPKADRQFVAGVRRLTRVHTRSSEEVISLDTDEIFDYPWVYAVEVGHWNLTDAQCKLLREYLLRGGFLMTDDFHGTQEWDVFMRSMSRIFPDRAVVEIPDNDPIFHTIYDLEHRIQVPGAQYLETGQIWEKDGVIPRWRAIYDDKGRIMVAMCHNQDNGDAWEWADRPQYKEIYSAQAYRMGIDYLIYSMTH